METKCQPTVWDGRVAQLVEQWIENPCVGGSSPPLTTLNKRNSPPLPSGLFSWPTTIRLLRPWKTVAQGHSNSLNWSIIEPRSNPTHSS
jgi:hypothetical protein